VEPADNLLTCELEAMAAIARVVGTLPDDRARQRVLRWACERFHVEGLKAIVSASALLPDGVFADLPAPADDPALRLDSLEDMFQTPTPRSDHHGDHDDLVIADPAPKTVDTAKQPVEAVLRSFVAEFQRFAEEWSGAVQPIQPVMIAECPSEH
jgi:hypothetical protein